jgi:hypothetical protein
MNGRTSPRAGNYALERGGRGDVSGQDEAQKLNWQPTRGFRNNPRAGQVVNLINAV